jgi:hypothetical protein
VIDNSHGQNGPFNLFLRNRAALWGILSVGTKPPSRDQAFIGNEIPDTTLLRGLYILEEEGLYHYGNHWQDSVVPAGTDSVELKSMYLQQVPAYYQNQANWPPIGLPNPMNAHPNEMEARYLKGMLTQCQEDTLISSSDTSKPDTTVSIPIQDPKAAILVYPNPTDGFCTLSYPEGRELETIQLLDLHGKVIRQWNSRTRLDLNPITPGSYLLGLFWKNQAPSYLRLIHR